MAAIYKNGAVWRAQVYVVGVRDSATFVDRRQAKEWASAREAELKRIGRSDMAPNRLARHSKKYLRHDNLFEANEIVSRSFEIGRVTGIYFLIANGEVVYVGQSINVHARVASHMAEKHFDRVAIVECSAPNLDELELLYIQKFKPSLNISGKPSAAAGVA